MSVEVVSLGCRLNLAESEQLRGLLAGAGELTVINSCAVTSEAVRQTRQAIRRAQGPAGRKGTGDRLRRRGGARHARGHAGSGRAGG